jgi:hypothetical protein
MRLQLGYRRRGAAVALVAITLVVLLGVGALAIDGGQMYLARTQLQVAADAAALAAASAIVLDEGMVGDYMVVEEEGRKRAMHIVSLHECLGRQIQIAPTDITFGRIEDPADLSSPFTSKTTDYNAVHVVAARTASSVGGPIGLFLAQIWGNDEADVRATAVAVMDDRLSGYNPIVTTLIPFTIWDEEYERQVNYTGTDGYKWDEDNNNVKGEGDGILEIHLYPYKLSGDTTNPEFEGSGNCGVLNIGVDSQASSDVVPQITDGVTHEDLAAEFGVDHLTFKDEDGSPLTFEANGNTGLMANLHKPLEERIGDVVGFLLHNEVRFDGSNAIYTIVDMRYGRIMDITLHGNAKKLILQPVAYAGPDVITDPDAPPTDLEVNRLVLAR